MGILPTVENACKLLVLQMIASGSFTIPTGSVHTGIDNEQKTVPEVICYAEDAEQLYDISAASGFDWWKVKTNIIVAHNAARSTRDVATAEADSIFNAFFDVSASIYLTNITSSFSCADVLDRKYSNLMEQDSWVQIIGFTLIATPND
jgi:hypothetical protein